MNRFCVAPMKIDFETRFDRLLAELDTVDDGGRVQRRIQEQYSCHHSDKYYRLESPERLNTIRDHDVREVQIDKCHQGTKNSHRRGAVGWSLDTVSDTR